ncbi:MAG: type II toxin-antitoxin system HicA family toxin [Spirochaetales bacterium]|nr:type II toxin-antitoxin system HicA family toxin [Spirochaetales bacterium]
MNRKNRDTLTAILEDPVRSDIPWNEIEGLLHALGAEITEGQGSRVRVALKGVRAVFHRPHPRRVTDKGSVKSVRRFLVTAGVKDVEV